MSRLLRFYAVRRAVALLAGGFAAYATLAVVGGPPEYFDEWPPNARRTLGDLVGGGLAVSWVAWLYLLLKPLLLGTGRWAIASRVVLGVAVTASAPDAYTLFGGVAGSASVEPGGLAPVVRNWLRVVGTPFVAGAIPLGLLEMFEWARSTPLFGLLFGRGHAARWAGPYIIARHTQPLPRRPVKGGFFTRGFIGGKPLAADSDGAPSMLVDKSPAHWCSIGGPGSGKNICSAPTIATYLGSLIHVSNKPDACDLIFGARVDQRRLEAIDRRDLCEPTYTDTRGITKTTCWVPGGRGVVLDYADQSVYSGGKHTLISDIDVSLPTAIMLALAVASGFFAEIPGGKQERWFVLAPRNFLAAAILHFLSFHTDPRTHNLPYIVERCMGFDRLTGEAGPQVMKGLIDEMLRNNHPVVGAFVRTTAVQIMELGSRSYGTLKSEFHNSCAAVYDPEFRKQLTGRSSFSYYDIGQEGRPFSLMLVLPRGDAGLRSAVPIFRARVELAMQILQTRRDRPTIPTALVVDEARQFLQGVECVTKAPMLLRDARVRMWQIYQSWTGVVETLGERGAAEMEACSVMSYFGLDGDYETARRVSARLGRESFDGRRGVLNGHRQREDVELVSPDRIMRELSIRSPLAYMMGPGMEPLRVERLAFKPLTTREGCRFQGLPMTGQYDEGLSRYRYGDGRA